MPSTRSNPKSGQKRRFGSQPVTSGLPVSTDILRGHRHISKVPQQRNCHLGLVSGPSRLLADRLTEDRASLQHAEGDCITSLKIDSRKASANRKGDRAAARRGIRSPDCVVGSCCLPAASPSSKTHTP